MNKINLRYNKGLTLIISMIILVGILYLTLANMNRAVFTQAIVYNEQSNLQSKLAADAAVKEGEQVLLTTNPDSTEFTGDCTNGMCTQNQDNGTWNNSTIWNNAKSISYDLKTKANLIEDPKYLIEYLGDKKQSESMSQGSTYNESEDYTSSPVYRVTGKSKGKTGKKKPLYKAPYIN